MSNALAIASVTAVLKDLLNNGIIDHQLSGVVGEVTVSALPPDRLLVAGEAETSRINLFMYHVAPNAAWRSVGLPSRSSKGDRTANPPLALDLYYLVTARANTTPRSSSATRCSCCTRIQCCRAKQFERRSLQSRR